MGFSESRLAASLHLQIWERIHYLSTSYLRIYKSYLGEVRTFAVGESLVLWPGIMMSAFILL